MKDQMGQIVSEFTGKPRRSLPRNTEAPNNARGSRKEQRKAITLRVEGLEPFASLTKNVEYLLLYPQTS